MIKRTIIMLCIILSAACPGYSQGDNTYGGITRKFPDKSMVTPYGVQVTFTKTVHILFPAKIVYVDLGSDNIIAGKADGAENVLRVKASVQDFSEETNFSVICDDGSFYSFNAKYVNEPEMLNIEMMDLMDSQALDESTTKTNVFLNDLENESPLLVKIIMKAIYEENKREVKHIGSRYFGIQFYLKAIYIHNDMYYLHTQLNNTTNVSFQIDFIRFKIIDKKVPKRTAIQETIIYPVRTYNEVSLIKGGETVRTVFAIPKFSIPHNKYLLVELVEKDGARNQTLYIEGLDLNNAKIIKNLKL